MKDLIFYDVNGCFTGVCGDPFEGRESWWATKPFNEFNIALPTYQSGSRIRIRLDLSANHGGKFGFSICQRTSNLDQACFSQHLTRIDIPGERWFWMMTSKSELNQGMTEPSHSTHHPQVYLKSHAQFVSVQYCYSAKRAGDV